MTNERQANDTTRDDRDVGEAFKREGPTPASEDTGDTVDEMNREAERSIIRNIRPEDTTD